MGLFHQEIHMNLERDPIRTQIVFGQNKMPSKSSRNLIKVDARFAVLKEPSKS